MQSAQRRGAASAFGVVLTGVMVVLLSMTLDLSYIHVSQSELQRTCDSAALAGCWALYDAKVDGLSHSDMVDEVMASANEFCGENRVAGSNPYVSAEGDDVIFGHYDIATKQFSSQSTSDFNAVRVSVHRQQNINGEVPLLFGNVLGRSSQPMSSTSTAALIHRIDGFHTPPSDDETIDLLPFALDEDTWDSVVSGQTEDEFTWNDGSVTSGSNGKHECNLYPQGTGSPGNRGTVDIGPSNNSTSDIARQILDGVSAEDLSRMESPFYFDINGRMYLNGDTGISAGVKDELQSIIGEKRIIPVFSEVNGNGNNAVYTIVKLVGVRILDVKLTGRMSQKRLVVEPAPVLARYARISTDGESYSDFVYTPVMLVQ